MWNMCMVYRRPGFKYQEVPTWAPPDFIQLILLTIYCNHRYKMITKPPRCFTMSWVFPFLLDTKMGSIFISLLCHYLQYFGFSLITRYKGEVYFYPPIFCYRDTRIWFHRCSAHLPSHERERERIALCFFLTSENKRFACDNIIVYVVYCIVKQIIL